MRHRNHRYRLGRDSEHRTAMLRNLLVSLFRHERVSTTEAKAKAVRGLADRMITLAKRESLHARRQVLAMVPDREVVARLFDQIAARFADRPGGYTRIIHAGVRRGDAAPLVYLELVDRPAAADGKGGKGEKGRKKEARGRRGKEKKAAAGA
ncbi:MAG TPA: 50S ribosomal protein L17 [Candidatus Binatia bacterium]|nr:50S ribosomal protein L17 [Candidatus Binatia bacterium]